MSLEDIKEFVVEGTSFNPAAGGIVGKDALQRNMEVSSKVSLQYIVKPCIPKHYQHNGSECGDQARFDKWLGYIAIYPKSSCIISGLT